LFALHNSMSNLKSLDAFYDLKMHQNVFAVGALPRIPLEELTELDLRGHLRAGGVKKGSEGKGKV